MLNQNGKLLTHEYELNQLKGAASEAGLTKAPELVKRVIQILRELEDAGQVIEDECIRQWAQAVAQTNIGSDVHVEA